MNQSARELLMKAANLIKATDVDARERSKFYDAMRQMPGNKQLILGGLSGLSATGMVLGGAGLLTPNEAQDVLTGKAAQDDALEGGLLTAGALGGLGAAGLSTQAYLQRMGEVAAEINAQQRQQVQRVHHADVMQRNFRRPAM